MLLVCPEEDEPREGWYPPGSTRGNPEGAKVRRVALGGLWVKLRIRPERCELGPRLQGRTKPEREADPATDEELGGMKSRCYSGAGVVRDEGEHAA